MLQVLELWYVWYRVADTVALNREYHRSAACPPLLGTQYNEPESKQVCKHTQTRSKELERSKIRKIMFVTLEKLMDLKGVLGVS